MSKRIEILDDLRNFNNETLDSIIGSLLTVIENIGYAYDIEDECCEDVGNVLDAHDVEYLTVEEDV